TLAVNEHTVNVDQRDPVAGRQSAVIDGVPREAFVVRDGDTVFIHLDGEVWEVSAIDPIAAAGGGGAGANAVRAPMPGVVVTIEVAAGDSVHAGQTLMVIESMKLQTSIVAERDGVIEAVCFATEATFDKGAELVRYVDAPAS
ncbi:MAG: acetyl-CoA carboxylase biotin carboxyl carrier protein subunit, partial [Gammaproteobacteria bacterium]